MRLVTTVVLWLLATVALTLAVPAVWAQQNLIDTDGYAALAQRAAGDPALQRAVAAELASQVTWLIHGYGYRVDAAGVQRIAAGYTAGPDFPAAFVKANRSAHDWLFDTDQSGPWVIDLAPMLADSAFAPLLSGDAGVPASLTIPLQEAGQTSLRAGQLAPLAGWGRWVGVVAVALAGSCALLTLIVARRRGRALVGLGISALLAGAAGWAGIETVRGYLDGMLRRSVTDVRRIIEVIVTDAVGDLHHWLNWTLAAGGALVVLGVAAAMLAGLRKG